MTKCEEAVAAAVELTRNAEKQLEAGTAEIDSAPVRVGQSSDLKVLRDAIEWVGALTARLEADSAGERLHDHLITAQGLQTVLSGAVDEIEGYEYTDPRNEETVRRPPGSETAALSALDGASDDIDSAVEVLESCLEEA
ncbi:MAG: hypothetical protein M3134_07035 [Actinomycetota bacterium]|nr:hypothetical protein [Actinomycetota bacterium]